MDLFSFGVQRIPYPESAFIIVFVVYVATIYNDKITIVFIFMFNPSYNRPIFIDLSLQSPNPWKPGFIIPLIWKDLGGDRKVLRVLRPLLEYGFKIWVLWNRVLGRFTYVFEHHLFYFRGLVFRRNFGCLDFPSVIANYRSSANCPTPIARGLLKNIFLLFILLSDLLCGLQNIIENFLKIL